MHVSNIVSRGFTCKYKNLFRRKVRAVIFRFMNIKDTPECTSKGTITTCSHSGRFTGTESRLFVSMCDFFFLKSSWIMVGCVCVCLCFTCCLALSSQLLQHSFCVCTRRETRLCVIQPLCVCTSDLVKGTCSGQRWGCAAGFRSTAAIFFATFSTSPTSEVDISHSCSLLWYVFLINAARCFALNSACVNF